MGEAEQRRELRVPLATAALGKIREKAPVADAVQPVAQLPGGVQERTAVAVEDDLGFRAALFLPFPFRHLKLGPRRKARTRERDHAGDAGDN
jgi:hypothetical protein